MRLEIQSLTRRKDEAVANRIEDKCNASTRAGNLTGDINRLNDEMASMKEVMRMQNKTVDDKEKAIEKWEKRCGEAEKRCVKLQREKDTEGRKLASVKKHLEDLKDEKDKMEEIMNGRLEEANSTKFESELE